MTTKYDVVRHFLLAGIIGMLLTPLASSQTATITTIAGNGSEIKNIPDGSAATGAQISFPFDVDIDNQNNLYFIYGGTEGASGTPDVYRISNGLISKAFSLTSHFNLTFIDGLAVEIDTSPTFTTPRTIVYTAILDAGASSVGVNNPTKGFFTYGTYGGNFKFNFPLTPTVGIRVRNGDVYVADSVNNRIIKGTTVIGGDGTSGYAGDGGSALQARFSYPQALALDAAGNVFVADTNNHCIRKIAANGLVTSFAGTCTKSGFSGDGGKATAARLLQPRGIAVAPDGTVYISDSGNNRIRRVNPNGSIETIAGGGTCYSGTFDCVLGDGGIATLGTLKGPTGIALDTLGHLYIADTQNSRIRMLTFGPAPTSTSPHILENGIINAASLVPPISRGAWAAIMGSNFSSKPARSWTAADFAGNKLPTSLDGVSVTFNDIPAAMLYVSDVQLNVQVPDGLPEGGVTVRVTTPGGTTTAGVTHLISSPALFTFYPPVKTVDGTSYFYGAAVHLDGTLVGRPNVIPGSRPAVPGEIIEVFGTGYGASNPPQPSGMIISTAFLSSIITVTFGGNRDLPQAAALVSAGAYQFNVNIPFGLKSGLDYSLQIGFLGGAQSQTAVYIPII